MKLSIQAAWRAPLATPVRLLIASAMLFAPLAGLAAIWLTVVASAAFLQSLQQPNPAILVSIVLGSITVVFWPVLLLCGYFLRTVREASRGSQTLPKWNQWFSLTIDGLALVVTFFLISLWPLLPVFVGSGLMMGFAGIPGMANPNNDIATTLLGLLGSVVGIVCLIGFLLALLALTLLAPMAILRLARTNSVLSAANPFGVIGDIFRGGLDYLIFWAVVLATAVGVHLAMGLVSLLSMGILTPVVVLLAPVTYVYLKLFSAQLLGQYGGAHLKC